MEIRDFINNNILLFDGGMGTVLQQQGMPIGGVPDLLNIDQPEMIINVHKKYVEAGCDIITTNTFGCNKLKIDKYPIEQIISAAVSNAKAAKPKYVALDIGPIGQLLEPMGTVSFEQCYDLFAQQIKAGVAAGVDVILFETISDLLELKIGILAAKELCDLPIFATMTYQEDGRTFVGTDPMTATITLNDLGVSAQGVNCSLGPNELMPIVETILEYSKVPVMVQANAGLPDMSGNYNISDEEYTKTVSSMIEAGVNIVGGCCGTTPEYIEKMSSLKSRKVISPRGKKITAATSGSMSAVLNGRATVIGERINPTGKPKLKAALRDQDMDYIINEAIIQTDAGADVLDVNMGLPEIDEVELLKKAIIELQSVTNLPLQIDSADPTAIEEAVRRYNGKPIINSVNGKQENMEDIFPIVKKYGACVIGLCLDETGIPATAQGRFEIAKKIVNTAAEYGIPKENILIDCLVLTASAQQEQVMQTLNAIKMVKQELGVCCVLGVSNVSFGLPNRELLNSVFLASGFGAGLDAGIVDPLCQPIMDAINSFRVINNQDINSEKYIESYSGQQRNRQLKAASELDLKDIIIEGRKDEAAGKVQELLKTKKPIEIIDNYFVPALNIVGERFGKREIFLPQLMQSAQTVKNGFKELEGLKDNPEGKGKIVLATVQGDIHDIGKNIVKMMLKNYGYDVIDLGKDVPIDEVVKAAQGVKLVGLSALMTTTVKNMQKTIEKIRETGNDCKIMVGGAVLSPEYARMVGADYYARDAQKSVEIAEIVFSE